MQSVKNYLVCVYLVCYANWYHLNNLKNVIFTFFFIVQMAPNCAKRQKLSHLCIYGVLRDLVPFVQFKKRDFHIFLIVQMVPNRAKREKFPRLYIYGVLPDLVPFVQFKKREKHS